MDQSLYIDQVKQYFPGLITRTITRLNDTTGPNANTYLHKRMLRPQLSLDMKWNSLSVANSIVAADVVAMDSSLPLKRRDSIARASGDIPKMGMEMAIREKELTELDYLASQPNTADDLVARLYRDSDRCITGIYERNEFIFLQALSSGVALVPETQNVGTGIRVDYGYLTTNKFGAAVIWSSASTATPLSDLARVKAKASLDGNNITTWMLDQATFNQLIATPEARQIFAASQGLFVSTTTNIPTPTFDQMNAASQARYGFGFQIVERSVRVEKNGVQTAVKPWTAGAVVGLTNTQVGTLAYGRLAEMAHPVENVNYTTVDNFILLSKFRLNRPSLAEITNSQALVLPVIDSVDQIYLIDTTAVQS
jgi:hypothetical protein